MPTGQVDTSGIERLADDLDHGAGSVSDRARRFCRLYPSEVAKLRRQVRKVHPQVDLQPVPVNGSGPRGLRAGYFATRLRDGSLGYLQRRTDDCLQAAIATCLQIPPHEVPDLHIARQLFAGKDPEEIDRGIARTMGRWEDEHGVTVRYHARPPTSARRWIGVVTETADYDDHCLLLSRRDRLFDPANLLPSVTVSQYDATDCDYGITIERS
jgi:hypothetical protein